ncbi:glycoside hydrolase family 43 protein [Actinoplanes sp. ATCC 53533]|uniref:glycoside hydrolase family 43 protein n=1 Tax=Actinoplanes sp. ATCC 53533 TaxID=1288362 RepID=UPI000F76E016|nr:glycoside hydrolase family 43 protein [Actinoplanes sp. ATCC 53533]RSM56553.1 glycoside hydrolase family 43 protein [Actinoplanes sp. ATCC 53533]
MTVPNAWPVIPGFHPDPSICRAGDDYYLATSSFEYFPGVPVFHSHDLVHWTQIGNALTRASQLAPGAEAGSRGIYAPTLRHHDGPFWLITTNVSHDRGHLIVTADDPHGPWSDPVFLDGAAGIDPDIAWDEAGQCYVTWHSGNPARIVQAAADPEKGVLLEAPRTVWAGTGLAWPEAPHLYRRDGWWYLMIAEGGTERGHCVAVARSRSITGPFESAPHNPVFSHRSTGHPVQNTGHADLVERPDGEWAAVYLGTRPRGTTPGFHVNGRETFLAGVDWVDGWPAFDESHFETTPGDHSFADDFRSAAPHPRWVSPNAAPAEFTGRDHAGALRLLAGTADGGQSGILAVRAYDPAWSFSATVSVGDGAFRLLLRVDERHWCALDVEPDRIGARLAIGPLENEIVSATIEPGPVTLHLASRSPTFDGPDDIELGVGSGAGYRRLTAFDGRYLSTEVAGGFTGRVIGLQALSGAVTVHEVRYASR